MKPGQQFKIDSIEELKEVYDPEKWYWPLKMEITDFEIGMNYAVNYNGNYLLLNKSDDYETIPNPFKKSKWQRIKDILEDPECEKWEDVEEKDPIREELKALREEVEKLKNPIKEYYLISADKVPDFIEGDNEICDWLNCKGENPIPKEPLFEWIKKQKEEKPKESEDLKIKWNHCELCIEENKLLKYLNLRINDGRDNCSIPIEKPEAIKIVNYLKKHFEIES